MTSTQRCPICKSELRKVRKTEFHYGGTVFENLKKGLIQHCERSELRVHFDWTKVNQKGQKCFIFDEFLKT